MQPTILLRFYFVFYVILNQLLVIISIVFLRFQYVK